MNADLLMRLRVATGPDRELDAEIEWLISPWKNLGGGWREHKTTGERDRFDYLLGSPPFTASIDAALTLMPEDAYWLLGCGKVRPDEPLYGVQIRPASVTDWDVIAESEHETSLPLAIVIAALTARACKGIPP